MLPAITIDIGTTSVKLGMFDAVGTPRALDRYATPTKTDEWGEIYDLEALTRGIVAFITGLDPELKGLVSRIAITGVGESGGLVRADMSLASPMILWHDHRGSRCLESIPARDRDQIYRVTGLPLNANYGMSKIAWAADHAGANRNDAQWLNIAEFLAALMTGSRWSEFTLASRTMALDLSSGTWSPEVCALFGLDTSILPELRTAADGSAVTPEFAQRTGIGTDVYVHVAGHDHIVGAAGADLQPGELLNSTGTTEGLLFLTGAPRTDSHAARSKLANGIASRGSAYTLFASIPTGGSAFATLRSLTGLDSEQLSACIAGVHQDYLRGSVDLARIPLVLPQFRGSPPPIKDAMALGIIAGLRTDTTASDLVLGCFLGLVLQFRDVLALFETPPSRIKVIGPATRNDLWLQVKADLLGMPLSVSRFPEVVSRGAQALASGQTWTWGDSDPREVRVDEARQSQLQVWTASIRQQWEYLKGMPV